MPKYLYGTEENVNNVTYTKIQTITQDMEPLIEKVNQLRATMLQTNSTTRCKKGYVREEILFSLSRHFRYIASNNSYFCFSASTNMRIEPIDGILHNAVQFNTKIRLDTLTDLTYYSPSIYSSKIPPSCD